MNAKSEYDPYHKWFGIPKDEQPPNHYRLLRVTLFEADAEVIENAYNKEMGNLKQQEHGPHADLVEPLSRELIAARTCLLDARKKAAYDAELREERKAEEEREKLVAEQTQREAIDEQVRLRTLPAQTSVDQRGALREVNRPSSKSTQLGAEEVGTTAPPNVLEREAENELHKVAITPQRHDRSGRELARLRLPATCLATLHAVDRLLAKLAGDGNTWLHGFLRVAAVVLPIAALVGMISLAIGGPDDQAASEKSKSESARDTNKSPEMSALSDRTVVAGNEVTLIAQARDPDDEAADLRFSLQDAPIGASIDSINGHFRWTPTDAQAGRDYRITVRVEDDGTPPGSDENSFVMTVTEFNVGIAAGQERDENGLKMQLCWCPPGEFTMGSPTNEPGTNCDEDQVEVTLTRGFWLGKHEVTQNQWVQVMGTSPWNGKSNVKEGADYPATYVNWDGAMEFCRKLTEEEQRAGRLPTDWQYTLPTEAQWEYACRAGTSTRFSFGDDESQLGEFAWFDENAYDVQQRYAHQVGVKKPNAWCLHDMHGNVYEWCRDWYMTKLPGGTNPEVASSGSSRVIRGGSWGYCVEYYSAYRSKLEPGAWSSILGFRVAVVPQ